MSAYWSAFTDGVLAITLFYWAVYKGTVAVIWFRRGLRKVPGRISG